MSISPFQFRRHCGRGFRDALDQLVDSPQGQWWRDVLVHRDLVLAVRNDTLNVYHRGASIFRIVFRDGAVVPETHVKYLVRQQQAYATLAPDNGFVLPAPTMWSAYEGMATLNEMIAAARGLAGLEKSGLHALIAGNPRVIDVEVAFRSVPLSLDTPMSGEPGVGDVGEELAISDDGEAPSTKVSGPRQDRLDAVTLEEREGALWIVFHEAKHFINAELRAGPQRTPPVAAQIARYRTALQTYAPAIATSYTEVCQALVVIDAMRNRVGQIADTTRGEANVLDQIVQRAAQGELLQVDPEPRLIVFGFDQDQRDGPVWTRHRDRLTELGLTVRAVGNPKAGGAAAFAYRDK